MLKNTTEKYGSFTKALHWLMAALIVTLVIVGLYMGDLGREDPLRRGLYNLHKSLGVSVMFLIIVRLAWLRISPAPSLPAVFTEKEIRLVSLIKATLYLLMVLIPVSGYLMSVAGGHPVSFFGLFDLPSIMGKSKDTHEIFENLHSFLADVIIGAVLFHVAGAVKHRIQDKNGESDILNRML
jgi:cytochrome b561